MGGVYNLVLKVSKIMVTIAGAALTVMMLLTVADVLGRVAGHPVLGTYEIVGLLGVVAIAFAIPYASWKRQHVYLEILLEKISPQRKNVLNISSRIACIILFLLIGINLFHVGTEFSTAREVSMTLSIPLSPFAYGAGICCFFECVIFVCDIVKICEGKYE